MSGRPAKMIKAKRAMSPSILKIMNRGKLQVDLVQLSNAELALVDNLALYPNRSIANLQQINVGFNEERPRPLAILQVQDLIEHAPRVPWVALKW